MKSEFYLNIRTNNLDKSKEFFTHLGFEFDQKWTNHEAAALIIAQNIYAMIHTDKSFRRFTDKVLCDSKTTTEALFALSCSSKAEVDTLVKKAVEAGGKVHKEVQDYGFMYSHAFEDLDGHIWEVMFLQPDKES